MYIPIYQPSVVQFLQGGPEALMARIKDTSSQSSDSPGDSAGKQCSLNERQLLPCLVSGYPDLPGSDDIPMAELLKGLERSN
jgi:hypothetical protein